jgi:hypothetical protein
MSFLKRLMGKNNEPTEVQYAIASGVAAADAGRSPSEVDREKQLAENSLLMEDPNLDGFLKGLCTYEYPEIDFNTGKPTGKTLTAIIPKYVAARILGTNLIRSSYIDKREAQLGIINTRCILRRVKMKMSESEYEQGGALVIDSIGEIVRLNYLCAENGRLALVMKSSPRSMEVKIGKPTGDKN